MIDLIGFIVTSEWCISTYQSLISALTSIAVDVAANFIIHVCDYNYDIPIDCCARNAHCVDSPLNN